MNDSKTNQGGWEASNLRTLLNNDIYNAMPSELRNAIINTTVVSGHGRYDSSNFTTTDKIYLLSAKEIWGSNGYYQDSAIDDTRQLDNYEKKGVTVDNYRNATKFTPAGSSYNWWIRTACDDYRNFYHVEYSGNWSFYTADSIFGVSPAFRIA